MPADGAVALVDRLAGRSRVGLACGRLESSGEFMKSGAGAVIRDASGSEFAMTAA